MAARAVQRFVREGTMARSHAAILLLFGIVFFAESRFAHAQPVEPAGVRYLRPQITFNNVDVATVLRRLEWFRVQIPLQLRGRVSVRLQGGIPWNDSRNSAAYWVAGTIQSDWLEVEGAALEDVQARIIYQDGVLRLGALSFSLPDAESPGRLTGSGQFQVNPLGNLSGDFQLDRLAIRRIFRMVEESGQDVLPTAMIESAIGAISGNVKLSAPGNRIRDFSAWHVTGDIRLPKANLGGFAINSLAARSEWQNGRLTLTDATVDVEGLQGTLTHRRTCFQPAPTPQTLHFAVRIPKP
jgi:hypothetical protein